MKISCKEQQFKGLYCVFIYESKIQWVKFYFYIIQLLMHSNHLNYFVLPMNNPVFTQYYLHNLYQPLTQFQAFQNYTLSNNFFYSQNLNPNQSFFQKQNRTVQNKIIVQQLQSQQKKSQNVQSRNNTNQYVLLLNQKNLCRQKYGRNITSNIFRSLIRRICGQNSFKKIIQKAIICYKIMQITYQAFVDQINVRCKKLSSYVRKNQMRSFWTPKAGKPNEVQFCKLFRICCQKYFKQEHVLNVFYSKKINRESRLLHFTFCRQMSQLIRQ